MAKREKKERSDSEQEGNPTLVMHCRGTKLIISKVVLNEGVDPYSVKVASDVSALTGHERVNLESDGGAGVDNCT